MSSSGPAPLTETPPPVRGVTDDLFPGRLGVSIQDLAKAFGFSRDTIERAITRGDLVAFGWPGGRRITVDSIRAFIGRGVKPSPLSFRLHPGQAPRRTTPGGKATE